MQAAQAAYLPDGRRLHLHHGPIDLILDADGPGRDRALARAEARFSTILADLVGELPLLRAPVESQVGPTGAVARAMWAAVRPFAPDFVTPMAAVAGAVADEILRAMTEAGGLRRAYVNNGGDIALHLEQGAAFTGLVAAGLGDRLTIDWASPVRGLATSGWRGRSQSLGIADAVTVLAATAAQADAAATMIANAVDLPGSRKIRRVPARDRAPDSDLGDRLVTVGVAPLTADEIAIALDNGLAHAETCRRRGLIHSALLTLSGERRISGAFASAPEEIPCHA